MGELLDTGRHLQPEDTERIAAILARRRPRGGPVD